MKNITKVMMSLVFCLITVFSVTACGKVEIKSAAVKNGTLETTIVKGEELVTSNTIVIYTYDDNSTKEVPASKLKFSEIDTDTIAKQTLTITYDEEEYSFDVQINVVASEADVNSIEQLESQVVNDYNRKRLANSSKESSFIDHDEPLYVGNDNKFDFRIIASGEDGAGNEVDELRKVRTNIEVYEKEGLSYDKQLTGDALDAVVTIDNENNTLKFAEDVIDREFKIVVTAVNADPDYADYTYFNAFIKVVDGYNVYEAYELSIYDNVNKDGAWTALKNEWGLTDVTAKSLILQQDISIDKDVVPSSYLWSEESPNYATVNSKVNGAVDFIGTPIDKRGTGIYHRKINNGETFNFIGNYFQIDLSEFPKMVIESTDAEPEPVAKAAGATGYVISEEGKESYITSHFCVFYTEGVASNITSETQVNWKNFNFNGNGEIGPDPENSGAILLMKDKIVNFKAYNTLMNCFYIGYFFEYGNKIDAINYNEYIGEFEVDSCKGYDSFQDLFYTYGAEHVLIKNSEFIGAGGPAIIACHSGLENGDINTGYPTTIDIVESNIESKVTASSFWFSNYGMSSYVSDIASADQLYTAVDGAGNPINGLTNTGKTIIPEVKDGKSVMNIIAVLLPDNRIGACQGYIRVFDTVEDYEAYYDEDPTNNPEVYGLDMMRTTKQIPGVANIADLALTQDVHFLESSGNGGYVNSGVASNLITTQESIVLQKINGLHDLMKNMGAKLGANMEVPGFASITLEQQKAALIQGITTAVTTYGAYVNADAIYDAGRGIKISNDSTIDLIMEVSNWSELNDQQKLANLTAQINSINIKSYADGDYINLYTGMGLGGVIALYDQPAA